MVQTILRMSEVPKPDHAADALAVAICHAGSMPAHRLASSTRPATR
jgi:crossover junction endodeoxyribonuclease RuvC